MALLTKHQVIWNIAAVILLHIIIHYVLLKEGGLDKVVMEKTALDQAVLGVQDMAKW